MAQRRCGYCHRTIPSNVHPYTMRIELFPRVADSLTISPSDLQADFDAEMRELIAKLEAMSEEQIRLQEERMYTRFCFVLCPDCRDGLVQKFRQSHHVPDP